jgi:hypothetical protein
MIGSIVAALFMGAATGPIQVDVGRAKWDSLPSLKAVERALPSSEMVVRVEKMLADGQCRLPGQSAEKFDITIPYAVLVRPDGSADRVLVAETGCEALETYVGLIVGALAKNGDFRPTGEVGPRWFASELNFNLQ